MDADFPVSLGEGGVHAGRTRDVVFEGFINSNPLLLEVISFLQTASKITQLFHRMLLGELRM